MSLRKLHDPVRTGLCPSSSPGSSGPSHGRLPLGCEQQTPVITQTWMGQAACLLLDERLAGLTSIASETLHAGLSALKATADSVLALSELGWRGWHAGQGVFSDRLCMALDSQPDIQAHIFCNVLHRGLRPYPVWPKYPNALLYHRIRLHRVHASA
jgi:hypothetical protein